MNERALAEALGPYRAQVDSALRALVERWAAPLPLGDAMAYATLSGGKRVRPAMTVAACEAAGGAPSAAMPYALALELIHTYSLVHDDLPSMDDDDERRGKPTVHVAFDVATAILTGDAILTEAFRVAAAEPGAPDSTRARGVARVAEAAGHLGMVGGQMRDIGGRPLSRDELRLMHAEKTGALFVAACDLGALAAGASAETASALHTYGLAVGRAFQVSDDLLDVVEAGGQVDDHEARVNFAIRFGLEAAREQTAQDVASALEALETLPERAPFLESMARWIGQRAEQA